MILGGAALLHPLSIHSNLIRRELPLMVLVSLLSGITLFDNYLSRLDGIALIAIAAIYLIVTIRIARKAENDNNDTLTREQLAELPREETGNTVAFLWLAVALIILPMSTHMVIDNATVFADYFGVSELVMGLTLIAVGTSLPELATVIAGALKGEDDIAIGNLIGANIYNLAIVLGLPALIHPGSVDYHAFCTRLLDNAWRKRTVRHALSVAPPPHWPYGGDAFTLWFLRLGNVAVATASVYGRLKRTDLPCHISNQR